MLYYLFEHLDKLGIAGAGVFKYISFRASLAGILSLLLALIAGKSIIGWLQRQQIGETIRELGLEGQMQKKGTPTMGGIIIILSIIIPTLLLARLDNIYVVVMIISTIWMGVIGGIDDYIKVFKKDKEGMKATTKLIGQLMLGAIIAVTIDHTHSVNHLELTTNLPITKNILNYTELIPGAHNAWIIYIPIIIFIVMAVTNAVNLTDGIDGLAAGTTAIVGVGLGILAYAAGNIKVSEYLNIIYVPNSGEVVIFLACRDWRLLGFLVVQRLPCTSLHGRYRIHGAWWCRGCSGNHHQNGIAVAHSVWCFLGGKRICDFASILFQVHQKALWRGQKNFPYVAIAPSFSEKEHSRKQNHDSLLVDHHRIGFGNIGID